MPRSVSNVTQQRCWNALRGRLRERTLSNVMEHIKAVVEMRAATCEYREFDIPSENRDRVFLGWLREGWELVGVHPKGKGQRKPLPVAIMRRSLSELVPTGGR